MAREELQTVIMDLRLTIESEFIPWSQSRHKAEKIRTMNWRITLKHGDRAVLVTDYSAGIAHCPSYRAGDHSVDHANTIEFETERGITWGVPAVRILPDPVDVIYALGQDASVLDAGGFETWAGDTGYDPDSRKAEVIYRTCVDLALKLRAAIGEDGLNRLAEASQDF